MGILNERQVTRVTTLGSDVVVEPKAGKLHRFFCESGANASVVTLKDGSTTVATFAAADIPVGGLSFDGARFATSIVVNITASGGKNMIFITEPVTA